LMHCGDYFDGLSSACVAAEFQRVAIFGRLDHIKICVSRACRPYANSTTDRVQSSVVR